MYSYNPEMMQPNSNFMLNMPAQMYSMPMQQNPYDRFRGNYESRTLYIGNIDTELQDTSLFQKFQEYGQIDKWQAKTLKNSRRVIVSYVSKQDAERAQKETNHMVLCKNALRVLWKKNMREIKQEANIFVKEIDFSANEQDLEEALKIFGPIFSTKIVRKGKESWYGYVQFEEKQSAENAIQASKNSPLIIKEKQIFLEIFRPASQRDSSSVRKFNNLYVKEFPEIPKLASPEEIAQFSKLLKIKLDQEFEKLGTIKSSILSQSNMQDSENLKFYAFVCFERDESATEAENSEIVINFLQMDEQSMNQELSELFSNVTSICEKYSISMQKQLYVNNCQKKQAKSFENNLYTNNLKKDVTFEQVQQVFQEFGEVTSLEIRLSSKYDTKFAFVNFRTKDEAKNMISLGQKNSKLKELYENGNVYITFFLDRQTFQNYVRICKKQKEEKNRKVQNPHLYGEKFSNPFDEQSSKANPQQQPMMFQQQMMQNYPMMSQLNYNPYQMMPQYQKNKPNMPMKPFTQQNPIFQNQQQPFQPNFAQKTPFMNQKNLLGQMMGGQMNQQKRKNQKPQINQINRPQMPMQIQQQMQNPQMFQQQQYQQQQIQQQQIQYQQKQIPPQQIQQQQQQQLDPLMKSKQQLQEIQNDMSEFLKKDKETQRTILGELLFPMIKQVVSEQDQEQCPKITGMLIDFEVFEIQEILEFIENPEELQEKVAEAMQLLNSQ